MDPSGRTVAATVLASLLALTTTPAGAHPASSAAAAPAALAPWEVSQAQSVSGQNVILNSVHAPAAGDVWAVGYRSGSVGGATEFRTVVEHSSGGGAFTMVPSPDREGAPVINLLQDIHGVSSSDLWTVGWSRNPDQPARTLIEHWNGSSWTITPSADPGPSGNILNGVTAVTSNDAWAVGSRQDGSFQRPLVEHWDGSSWSAVAAPNPRFCSGYSSLSDVVHRSATDVYAVGTCSSSSRGGDQGFVLRWNGTKWTLPGFNDKIPDGAALSGASVYDQKLWFVGSQRDVGAFAMRNGRTGWGTVPLAARNTTLAAVVARGGGAAWAVGIARSPQSSSRRPGALRVTDGGGTATTVPVDSGSLRGAAWDPAGRVWAVGTQLPGSYNTPLIVSRAAP